MHQQSAFIRDREVAFSPAGDVVQVAGVVCRPAALRNHSSFAEPIITLTTLPIARPPMVRRKTVNSRVIIANSDALLNAQRNEVWSAR